MPDISNLILFIAAALVLFVTPGPAVLYIVARSIEQGRRAGIVSVLGISAGSLFHIAAAAFGVSALLASSALMFNFVKYLGAGYLIYSGVRKFLARDEMEQGAAFEHIKLSRIFYQGVIVNLLNPKTALFFFAFLPQFVDVSKGAVIMQILLLGIIFVALGILTDGLWAVTAGTAGNRLKKNIRFLRAQRYFSGSVFIALGVATAVSGSNRGK